jgi:PST family polysaccharide transporter
MHQYLIRLIKHTYNLAGPQEGRVVMKNVAFLSAIQAISYILPVIILPYLFRTLGADKFGLISFAQAFVQYFMILTDYGFSVSATKEISLCHNDVAKTSRIYSSVMIVKLVLLLVSGFILASLLYLVPKFQQDPLIYILSFGAVMGNTLFPVWFFQGEEKMKYIAAINIIGEIVFVAAIFLFIREKTDYLMVPVISSSVCLMTGLLGQYVVFRRFKVAFAFPTLHKIRMELKAGWNVFVSVLAINAYTNTRIFAVGLLTSNSMTGYYSIAEKIANVAQTFPLSSFSQAIFPRLSKIFHRSKALAFKIMQQIQLITVLVSLIFLPLIFIFTPYIVRLVCGGYYGEVILTLRLLIISVFFISANAFRVQFLLVCGKTKTYSRIHLTMAVVGLPMIILLIYAFSYVGAALATVLIEGGIFTITFFTVRKLRFPDDPRPLHQHPVHPRHRKHPSQK